MFSFFLGEYLEVEFLCQPIFFDTQRSLSLLEKIIFRNVTP